jgi:hypothetical protein
MRIDTALLCDAVTVREGLLHILGGGVTRINRPSFPAPLGTALALRVMVHPTEADRTHVLTVYLLAEDGGEQLAEVRIEFGLNDPSALDLGEEASLALPIGLHNVAVPSEGSYNFELLIDDIHQRTVPFRVVEIKS